MKSLICLLAFTSIFLCGLGSAWEQRLLANVAAPNSSYRGIGRNYAELNETVEQALDMCQVRKKLGNCRYKVLHSGFRFEPTGRTKAADELYRATIYDYTNGRTFLVNGVPFDPSTVSVSEWGIQPFSSPEELHEAGRLAGARPGDVVSNMMPPVIPRVFPNGTSHRILNIYITSGNDHKAYLVNMNNGTVEPHTTAGTNILDSCNAPRPANGSPSGKGVPGTTQFTTSAPDGSTLWSFTATRPSSSSGHWGSGIELTNVRYKGKLVLYRAHVPILNVQYDPNSASCGPTYRDWQYDEWPLRCTGPDIAAGFRQCTTPAKTILDDNIDGGNFQGVAVYWDGPEYVLKTVMKAGWYRYVMEWRFHPNGTLKPRFGFGAAAMPNNCPCHTHRHHAYWRFDFDIEGGANNLVREYNNPPLLGPSNYDEKIYEVRRPKDPGHKRHWEIGNLRTRSSYSLIPGSNDGTSDSWGIGDFWVVKYSASELEDYPILDDRANIDKFVNGELVKDADVVVWYGAHFTHDEHAGSHIVGPDLVPVVW